MSTLFLIRDNLVVNAHSKEFLKQVISDVNTLESHELGKELITRISNGKYRVTIIKDLYNRCRPQNEQCYVLGSGCGSTVFYNATDSQYVTLKGEAIKKPSCISFAHELIHALHNSCGSNATYKRIPFEANLWSDPEELHTIKGLPSSDDKITECALLVEHGLPERGSHFKGENPKLKTVKAEK